MPSTIHAESNRLREALAQACSEHPLTLIRGPNHDPRAIYIRKDLSAWGDESRARSLSNLSDEELSFSVEGTEHAPGGAEDGKDFLAEASHWRHVHGFMAWLDGGSHPLDLAGSRATGWLRGSADPDFTAQRARLAGIDAILPQSRVDALSDPGVLAAALDDPERHLRLWERDLAHAWHEVEFGEAISFAANELPEVPTFTPMMARLRKDGSWLFEHPLAPAWLCMMDARRPGPTRQAFPHNGKDIAEFARPDPNEPREEGASDERWAWSRY